MLKMILATSLNNCIGVNNSLPWRCSEDLQQFKNLTNGHKVIMGFNTFKSLPVLLKNRDYVIVSRDKNKIDALIKERNLNIEYEYLSALHKLKIDELVKQAEAESKDVWVIGGSSLYRHLTSVVSEIYLTTIGLNVCGTTHFDLKEYINVEDWIINNYRTIKADIILLNNDGTPRELARETIIQFFNFLKK